MCSASASTPVYLVPVYAHNFCILVCCVLLTTPPPLSPVPCSFPAHRSVICYFGHHYQAFVLSEELQQWLLFDDHVIKLVGDWQQVKAAMVADRLQPSLLFYESAEVAAAAAGG